MLRPLNRNRKIFGQPADSGLGQPPCSTRMNHNPLDAAAVDVLFSKFLGHCCMPLPPSPHMPPPTLDDHNPIHSCISRTLTPRLCPFFFQVFFRCSRHSLSVSLPVFFSLAIFSVAHPRTSLYWSHLFPLSHYLSIPISPNYSSSKYTRSL